jgi:hypothetical protein
METIPARTVQRWIDALTKAEAALQAAEDIRPMIPHEMWLKVHPAKHGLIGMRETLMRAAIGDVSVQTVEANKTLHDIFKPGLMTGFPRTTEKTDA